MKIVFTITTLLLLSTQASLLAQPGNTSDYLALNSGDTLFGTVKHVDQRGMSPKFYKKIRLTDSRSKRKKYKRNDVSAFRVNNTSYEGFWLYQSSQLIVFLNPKYDIDSQNGERYFLRVISKGQLSHYLLEWWDQEGSSLSWMDLLKKEEDQYFLRATQGIFGLKRKALANYFFNCPDLKDQIEQKRIKEVWQVVDFYNRNCTY